MGNVVHGQRIVVDTASSSKYLIKPENTKPNLAQPEEITFSDRAISIGKGILNRLKARLNLEEAAESIKDKKKNLLGRNENEGSTKNPKQSDPKEGGG